MGFEIWRHKDNGRRYLVVYRDGQALAAAGPIGDHEDPRQVLETHGNQRHNPGALLEMRRAPDRYVREYAADIHGRVFMLADPDSPAT